MRPNVYLLRAMTDGGVEGVFASRESAESYGEAHARDVFSGWGFYVEEMPLEG